MSKLSRYPVAILFTGALIISFSSVFVKVSQVAPEVSAFYRVFFGCLFLVPACWFRGEFRGGRLKNSMIAVLAGLAFSADLFCWHFAIKYVGPGLATILGNCQVFILALAGWLLYRERLRASFVLSIFLAMSGLYMIIGLDNGVLTSQYLVGIGMGILTAIAYACFLLLIRHAQSRDSQPPLFYYQVIVTVSSSLWLGAAVLGMGESFAIPTQSSLAALVGLGGLCQALAWAMISYFLPRVPASRAGLILLLQPSLSFAWDVLLFDRQTGVMGWVGVCVVLAAIYMGMRKPGSEEAE